MLAAAALLVIAGAIVLRPQTSTATGVVVAVDAVSLTDVRSFTLRVSGGQTLVFTLDALQNGVEFPPGHLAEHIGSVPIVVTYREENSVLKAIRLEDAPSGSAN